MNTNPNRDYNEPIYFFRHVLRFVRAIKSPMYSHCRCPSLSPNSLYVYQRDRNSPTGVRNVASIDAAYGREILERIGKAGSQLSPTEGQFSSRR